jgi:phosphate acetyltransferase
MAYSLYISTTESGSGKALVALGILDLILRKTNKVGFFRPIIASREEGSLDEDIDLILKYFHLEQSYEESYGLTHKQVNDLLIRSSVGDVLEKVIDKYKALEKKFDFILCEGSDYLGENSAAQFNLNAEIAQNLGCPVLILGNADKRSLEEAINPIKISCDTYQEQNCQVIRIILNKARPEEREQLQTALEKEFPNGYTLAVFPYNQKLNSPRIKDIARQLGAQVLYGEKRLNGLATNYLVAAMQMQHALTWLKEDSLVITPGDRGDVILGMLMADQSANYPHLAGLVLSTGFTPEPAIAALIEGLADPFPILSLKTDTYTTASLVHDVRPTLTAGDHEKIALSIQTFDRWVDLPKLEASIRTTQIKGITPKLFTYNLVAQAKAKKKHIVLPEGKDPRILQAAAVLLSQEIVDLTLLGKAEEIALESKKQGIQLDINALKIINPVQSDRLEIYSQALYELRRAKGMTLDIARDQVQDVSYFGTMMVYLGDADGMVSGAVHTTQHTIRPALQIIKTIPGFFIVSSVFFMCLSDRVLVYGDCAVNPSPNAEQLAEIAISSADTAQRFGIEPRVALLSYSSGSSGQGEEVEKVRQATAIAKERRPDLAIEGPIQYDAAVDSEVAAQKMPGSTVAGKATVFIFPDLNTGNNTYKAVQRETGAIAIGPVMQGLKKPVNDLSRGCTVVDIINTVAITAIQAQG